MSNLQFLKMIDQYQCGQKRAGTGNLWAFPPYRAHPEKCETVFGLRCALKQISRSADLIKSDRNALQSLSDIDRTRNQQ
ncbi:hypothetical protein CQ052_10610 [Ochrobactrum sp. MYb15]|nr:hypothetical protein CQZ90_09855 [Ochrobactrum sp. MYb19]PRA57940.1 hypothetical protein CQ062_04130 [Ochrobactrum sp. MYb68]PRA67327.1 hypothetical protein CQ053_08475 [Ochrobactrum sp. MYb18]PRA77713.1 hypothetical protein CQ049_10610 [Brucella thiophenivorans]PRA92337.1 hypothetical protein CQ051_09485 [Ochrobactrum sp. MYb14]PRA99723.1 hypothetical protein CQ052_10610 [Ochrobactrum sp. MYb15]